MACSMFSVFMVMILAEEAPQGKRKSCAGLSGLQARRGSVWTDLAVNL